MKASPTLSISLFIVKFLSIVKNTAQIGCKMHLSLSTTIEVMNVCYFCYLSGILVLTQLGETSSLLISHWQQGYHASVAEFKAQGYSGQIPPTLHLFVTNPSYFLHTSQSYFKCDLIQDPSTGTRWHLSISRVTLAKLDCISATTLARLLLRSQQRCKEVSSATRSGEMQGEVMPLHISLLNQD